MIDRRRFIGAAAAMLGGPGAAQAAGHADPATIAPVMDHAIEPLMREHGIPGMAVAVTTGGRHHFRDYGVASKQGGQRVTRKTLFEVGSVSKVFTGTLASYAQVTGALSLAGSVSEYLAGLRGSSFDRISLLDLGTYTAGELPLQVPDNIGTIPQLLTFLKHWKPGFAPGTQRKYSNISIGLLGLITAQRMGAGFSALIETRLFPALGMSGSFINVPASRMRDYAQGYTKTDAPIRMKPGVLAAEAYGVRSCAPDMIRFIDAMMRPDDLAGTWRRAVAATQQGCFAAGPMTQDLVWEQYPWPIGLKRILAGNSDRMIYQTIPASRLTPSLPPQTDVMIDKSGATNGFAAYVAFIPATRAGIVMLANKNYPIPPQVAAAYEILTRLGRDAGHSPASPPSPQR
jgi:beta-lactamase class C